MHLIYKKICSYFKIANEYNYFIATTITIKYMLSLIGITIYNKFDKRRIEISRDLDKVYNSTIQYGPFKNLILSNNVWWGYTDRASMILGFYEKEVLDSLLNKSENYKVFVNLGAADGYYSIGVLISNIFDSSICFETSKKGRDTIKKNALINGVVSNIDIRGEATKNFLNDFNEDILSKAFFLVDIEGSEFNIFDTNTFTVLKKSIIIIETHEFFFTDGIFKLNKLKESAINTHRISQFTTGSRDLSVYPVLKKFTDNDRWLICSEGRKQLMTWLRFDPI